jgi:hypothetical protein
MIMHTTVSTCFVAPRRCQGNEQCKSMNDSLGSLHLSVQLTTNCAHLRVTQTFFALHVAAREDLLEQSEHDENLGW